MPSIDLDLRIAAIAATQHGAFTLRQARAAGASKKAVRHRCESGLWTVLSPSVFALAASPDGWERRLVAALLGRPGSLACRRSAAALHGLTGFRTPSKPEIVIAYGGNARSRAATIRRSVYFGVLGRTVVQGFPVTDVAETLFMLAGVIGESRLARAVDECLAGQMVHIEELNDIHIRHLGDRIPGVKRFETVISLRQGNAYVPPYSELERMLNRVLDHPDVPSAVAQHPIPWSTGSRRVDVYIPEWTLIVEADGRRWHTRVEDFERDRERDNLATSHGIAVLRFTWRMLMRDAERTRDLLLETGRRRGRPVR